MPFPLLKMRATRNQDGMKTEIAGSIFCIAVSKFLSAAQTAQFLTMLPQEQQFTIHRFREGTPYGFIKCDS